MTNEKAIEIIKSECYVANLLNLDRTSMINSALDIAIKTLEQTRWIPCCERLPEENIHVLCHFYMGGMAECYHAHGMWHIVGGLRISCDEVVAWMPLPEPYKEVGNEEKED